MDAFEQLVSDALWSEGCWTQTEVKVSLTKEEKALIGRTSAPRWELDVVAYVPLTNTLRVIECKSYLDSTGVSATDLMDEGARYASRYKLFTDATLRQVVLNRLGLQFTELGACAAHPTVTLGMACGRFKTAGDRDRLREHFKIQGWELLDEEWLRAHLKQLATGSYENKTSAVVAKLLLRRSA
ncbi:hypothetical protein [Rhizobium halophilum]|uniref:hypothetical protein n=1 Tax=Rhizobium halophilum TaxID=2846852 RepID=UPI001EFE01CF|nr:hypothetical protein [Rhizobium halophilum]MCF6371257.1 hypothetical protein [Rhizobium halophilum]